MLPLILYDIPSKLPGNSWSPNPAKPRFVLNYKKLPFQTVWVEFPDIAPKLKEIGASPNTRRNGTEQYTVPVLSDPNTSAVITNSWAIAEYLDETYPEKSIFPNGTKGLIAAFDSAVVGLGKDAFRFTLLRTSQILNERSRECFFATGKPALGEKVEERSPEGPKRHSDDAHWEVKLEKGFYGAVKTWYDKAEGKWVMGDTFSYADIIIAAQSLWFKRVHREDEWKKIAALHDGKWEKLLSDVEKECNRDRECRL